MLSNAIEKWAINMKRKFTGKQVQTANRHIKRCSHFLVVRTRPLVVPFHKLGKVRAFPLHATFGAGFQPLQIVYKLHNEHSGPELEMQINNETLL